VKGKESASWYRGSSGRGNEKRWRKTPEKKLYQTDEEKRELFYFF